MTKEEAVKLLMKMADERGYSSGRVDDGQIFIFTRATLAKLIEGKTADDKIVIFVGDGPTIDTSEEKVSN